MEHVALSSFLSEKEAALYLSISLSNIRRWRRNGTGPKYYRKGNVLRERRENLEEFIQQYSRFAACRRL